MNSKPDKHNTILTRILESNQFKGSELYQNLLTYLVKAHQNDYIPKEISIAHDVFNKGADFNTAEDPSVRVHMHNLRNKLEQYYQSEGRNDELQLTIPKGHYQVKIAKKKPASPKPVTFNIKYLYFLLIVLFCSTFYLAIDKFFFHSRARSDLDLVPKNDLVWKEFFSNGLPTSIVIGDFLIFEEFDNSLRRYRRIQDYQINTEEQLDDFIAANPDRRINVFPLGELPHNSIYNMMDLHKAFLAHKQKFNLSFSTEISIDYIKRRNVVYLGEFKNLRVLSDLIATLPFQYQTLPDWNGTISFTQNDSLVTLRSEHDWGISRYVVDLGIIAKLPGQNNENYLLIMGFGYNSQIKLIDMISNKTALSKLESEIMSVNNGKVPEHFFAVFKVLGFDRASTTAKMEFFREVDADFFQNYIQASK